ncbi:AAA domain protein [uncultured archaeon]|nr:AAA domain protein [uncultured archaeon]
MSASNSLDTKIITITGISGSGTKEFCKNYNPSGMRVKVYNTGEMIYQLAQSQGSTPVPRENLVNLHPEILASLRHKAFDSILDQLDQDKLDFDRIIIDSHAQFFWNNVYTNSYDWKYLNGIQSDMFATIVDKPSAISERQMKTPEGQAQKHSLRDLILWQNIEVNVTQGWASNYQKPMYVFSSKQKPVDMESLLYNRFLIYSSFPMTDAESLATKKIVNFKKRLRDLRKEIDQNETPIIDPADIDIETDSQIAGELDTKTKDAIGAQTVHRDLNWDIGQATHVVAYYPDGKMSLSKGVSDECTRARETGKFVYVVCPRKTMSPFMDIAHKVFKEEEDFFAFFKEHMKWALEYYKR